MQIENYEIVPIGRGKDLSNQNFGDYRVLYRTVPPITTKSKQAHWLCQCIKCRKYVVKSASVLTKGVNQCNCANDLTNKKFGRWTVLYKTDKRTKNGGVLWHCRCDCGNEKDVNADILKRGESKSCGCLAKEKASESAKKSRIDLTGQRFGKLIALYPIYAEDKIHHTKWHCQCDCGNQCDVDMGNLRAYKAQSCGCTRSKQEENIIKLLIANNIKFNYQFRFDNMKNKPFDFYINNSYVIEYDGQQHFYYTGTGWDTKEHFERTRQNDLLKNQYCFENNIPLIRIPFNEEYNFEDLKLETTRYLLTKENEKAYYEKLNKGEILCH